MCVRESGGGGVDDGECSDRNKIYNSSIGSIICYQTLPMTEDLGTLVPQSVYIIKPEYKIADILNSKLYFLYINIVYNHHMVHVCTTLVSWIQTFWKLPIIS